MVGLERGLSMLMGPGGAGPDTPASLLHGGGGSGSIIRTECAAVAFSVSSLLVQLLPPPCCSCTRSRWRRAACANICTEDVGRGVAAASWLISHHIPDHALLRQVGRHGNAQPGGARHPLAAAADAGHHIHTAGRQRKWRHPSLQRRRPCICRYCPNRRK